MNQHTVTLTMSGHGSSAIRKQHLATFFERLACKAPMQRLLIRMGLDPGQFVLFLGLFRTLSEREELMGSIGVNRFNISYLALWIAGMEVFFLTLMILFGIFPPLPIFLFFWLSITFALTFLVFIREAANALYNPVEASMLAHIPIHGATYAAAKISHVLIAVFYLVLGLNAFPALIAVIFPGARWFWFLTHIASSFLIGTWTAFIICAFYGLIRRIVPARLLKNISMWIQLFASTAFIAIPIFFPSFLGQLFKAWFENHHSWKWLPLILFAEIGRLGCFGCSWKLEWRGVFSIRRNRG